MDKTQKSVKVLFTCKTRKYRIQVKAFSIPIIFTFYFFFVSLYVINSMMMDSNFVQNFNCHYSLAVWGIFPINFGLILPVVKKKSVHTMHSYNKIIIISSDFFIYLCCGGDYPSTFQIRNEMTHSNIAFVEFVE